MVKCLKKISRKRLYFSLKDVNKLTMVSAPCATEGGDGLGFCFWRQAGAQAEGEVGYIWGA
jgi:hypothetical protein